MTEQFFDTNVDGRLIVLEAKETPNMGIKYSIGNRFDTFISCYNPELAFDFFRNYATLLSWDEIPKGWECYQKAQKQLLDNKVKAFWEYFDGKILKKRGKVIQWMSV